MFFWFYDYNANISSPSIVSDFSSPIGLYACMSGSAAQNED